MTELFLSRAGESLDQDSRTMLDLVLASAGRMKQLISDILQLARVNSDPKQSMAWLPLDAMVESAVQNLREAIAESGTRIVSERLPSVYAHEGQMARLFGNLISNAIKYRGEKSA
jgi:two-component system, chemotaxis family, sensor kinase Cph1